MKKETNITILQALKKNVFPILLYNYYFEIIFFLSDDIFSTLPN